MTQKWRLRVAALFSIALLLLSVGIVLADTQGSDCVGDTSKVRLWENSIGDTGDGNDNLWACAQDTDLTTPDHLPPGSCKGAFLPGPGWNDCISSFTVWVPAGQCFVSYREAGYGTAQDVVAGPKVGVRINVLGGTNDTMTSFRWISC